MKIKRLDPRAIVPTYGSDQAAGCDLYAVLDDRIEIKPHETELIGTGWAFAVPERYFGAIFARSGLATKQGLRPANCIGVVDSDYRGEVKVALHNDSNEVQVVIPGERIAQFILIRTYPNELVEVPFLDETERGEGGFGSTGQ